MAALTESLENVLALRDDAGHLLADRLAHALVAQALRGNQQALRLIFEQCEGRAEGKRGMKSLRADAAQDRIAEIIKGMTDAELLA